MANRRVRRAFRYHLCAFGGRNGGVPAASKADIDLAVSAARKAFDESDWRWLTPADRGATCRDWPRQSTPAGDLAETDRRRTRMPADGVTARHGHCAGRDLRPRRSADNASR
ncbi:MAG: hypothetical protein EOP16_01870 [Pseudonocardia sp.]|nr:MAG: hypothetical protein EOP16_01870 [Pseudonocardia sp.]